MFVVHVNFKPLTKVEIYKNGNLSIIKNLQITSFDAIFVP